MAKIKKTKIKPGSYKPTFKTYTLEDVITENFGPKNSNRRKKADGKINKTAQKLELINASKEATQKLAQIRTALADYIASEGCGCCQDREGHAAAMNKLGKLLKMKKYADGSGYDYSKYRTKK